MSSANAARASAPPVSSWSGAQANILQVSREAMGGLRCFQLCSGADKVIEQAAHHVALWHFWDIGPSPG